ncbi:MAG: Choline-sulfatase [Verrucomicrobiota bacterium]|jgi:arylsulfatase A-like enzyme
MKKRTFLGVVAAWAAALLMSGSPAVAATARPPNVLFIAVDDLNDWIGPLRGHPQVKTPNIDRLARRGTVFSNAHCAAPICNPSRAAVFSGRQPFATGVYYNDRNIRTEHPGVVLLPEHFRQGGYRTFGTGKLLHHTAPGVYDEQFHPEQQWSPFTPAQAEYTDAELPSKGTDKPRHVTTLKGRTVTLPFNGMPSDRASTTRRGESFDWGPVDVDDTDMHDGQIAAWAVERLRSAGSAPLFLGVGFFRPHIPLFAPRKYFDLYAGLDIQLPEVKAGDLNDLSPAARQWALFPDTAGTHATVVKHGQWKAAVTAYLACISFMDAQIGKLLDAVAAGPDAGNTVIVLWGDHGWHLGEKEHWGKWTGWQRSTKTPLIVVPAENTASAAFQRGVTCAEPVSLLDLYPSLIELCGLPAREGLAGQSLTPLLRNPGAETGRHVLTTFDPGNYSVTGKRWHYIRYRGGEEELYDSVKDPHEWYNLAGQPESRPTMDDMARHLPKNEVRLPPLPEGTAKKGGKR